MHKPSPFRLNALLGIAAALGMSSDNLTTAEILREKRGKPGKGYKFRYNNVYIPGGQFCNVEPAKIRNPKIAAQVQAMHEKWWAAKSARMQAA